MVDTAAGGSIWDKSPKVLHAIYEKLGMNSQQRASRTKKSEMHNSAPQNDMAMQVADLARQMKKLVSHINTPK